uniref:SWIM-type domain-containing protein n=1 Tax=Lactuca sativa TaxID=4236 RepID=A0A9R1WLN6_LACSA|nr:hypothetical protein LSAT_V11C100048770 [Lactuca sativa]
MKLMHMLDKLFIVKATTLNIGATKAHKLRAAMVGGYDNLSATSVDYKNLWRDYPTLVGPSDAQCIIDQLIHRRDTYPNFYCNYKVKNKSLIGVFWVHETSKEYYSKFNDVISIDATYRTNKYKMIFVPFSAINNHQKTVTVGATLLSDERIESYIWMLNCFISAHGKPPNLILTDQDPALIHAISTVLPTSQHRLCMWHIMSKLENKVERTITKKTEFKSGIHKLVWNTYINPDEFEICWNMMLDEFGLRSNKWLAEMYNRRHEWNPTYFRHIPMSGLMKTTSRSESSNSFFNRFVSTDNLLVNFMLNFDTAISKQRHEQKKLDAKSNNNKPKMICMIDPYLIQQHASMMYTMKIFFKVQKDIKKAYTMCYQKSVLNYNNSQLCTVAFYNKITEMQTKFQVPFNPINHTIECSCGKFTIVGLLCCHSLRVLIDNNVCKIPDMYIVPRWRKDIISVEKHSFGQQWEFCRTKTTKLIEEACRAAESCINAAADDDGKLEDLIGKLHALRLERAIVPY